MNIQRKRRIDYIRFMRNKLRKEKCFKIAKIIFCTLIILISIFCGSPQQVEIERILEDGVEVVINHLDPYELKTEPAALTLEEMLTIDFEIDTIAELGVADVCNNFSSFIFYLSKYPSRCFTE